MSTLKWHTLIWRSRYFFLVWSSDISQHSFFCQWRSSLRLLPCCLDVEYQNLCDSLPPPATVINLWGFLPIPVHSFLYRSLESVFGNLSISPQIPSWIQRGSQATSPPHGAEKGKQVGFTQEHLPLRDPDWQSDSSSTEPQLSPQAYPGFRKQGRQSRPNTVLVYESELPGHYHNLHVTFKLEGNVTSVSVTLITKCARTILPPRAIGKLSHCGSRRACTGKGLFSVDFIPQHKPFTHGCWTWRTN